MKNVDLQRDPYEIVKEWLIEHKKNPFVTPEENMGINYAIAALRQAGYIKWESKNEKN